MSYELRAIKETLEKILRLLEKDLNPHSPITITFKEITMLPTVGGNTLVYTGTLQPAGAAYPAGTTFTVTSNDPAVSPTVDSTGTIVTVPLPTSWVESTTTPLQINYQSSTFTPNPPSATASLSAVITPSAPPLNVLTPTAISFVQTT